MCNSSGVPLIEAARYHTQFPDGILAFAKVVVVAPDVVLVVLSVVNTLVGEPASLVLAYLRFHVTEVVPRITSATCVITMGVFV